MYYSWHEGEDGKKLVLNCYIQPGASKTAIIGLHDGRLKVAVKEPPENDKANEGLVKFLANFFSVSKGCILVEKGSTSRYKQIAIIEPENTSKLFNLVNY